MSTAKGIDITRGVCYFERMNEAFAKITPSELAAATGMSPGFASQIKCGRRKLPIKYLRVVSKRFAIPVHDLRPDLRDLIDPNP